MNAEEDVRKLEKWAQSLGCPSKALPSKKTISRLFASGKMHGFYELMNRVRPQQEVNAIRDEIKVRKIERLGPNPSNVKRYQSEQFYLYEMEKKLKEQSEQLEIRLNTKKQQFEKVAQSLKQNNIEILQLKEEVDSICARTAICQLKSNEIDGQLATEKQISQHIDEITPVKYTFSNAIEKRASDALFNVKEELQTFYATLNSTESYDVNLAARQELWQKLREAFAQIPNLTLWSKICDQMKEKQMAMETLAKMNLERILYVDAAIDDSGLKNCLQIEIGKLHAKHIKLCIMRHSVDQKNEDINHEYVAHYESFLHDMRSKFAMYNNQNIDDTFLAEYLSTYSELYYGKGEIEYLLKKIEENEHEIERRKKSNDEYRLANMELSKIYEDIENLYVRSHEDIYNLSHVREKIQHSEELIRYLLQCKKESTSVLNPDAPARLNNSANSSYNSNNDSVLSSSRSDSFSSTSLASRPEVGVPRTLTANPLNELKIFLSIPIDKFKLRNPTKEDSDLCMNPLISPNVYNQFRSEEKLLIFDYLLTPNASIKQLKSQIMWLKQFETLAEEKIISSDGLPEVDKDKFILMKNQQTDTLAKLTDETSAIFANIHEIFCDVDRSLNFIKENPLRKWVPKSESFNGKSYEEYEREYMMYYKMIPMLEDE